MAPYSSMQQQNEIVNKLKGFTENFTYHCYRHHGDNTPTVETVLKTRKK